MIKINLLPYQKAAKVRRQQAMEVQFLLAGIIFVVFILALGFFWWSLNQKIDELTKSRDNMTAQLEVLKKKVKEVKDVEAKKKLVESKIDIIAQLKKNQQGPVHILDELSRHLPDRVWLVALTEHGDAFDLEGRATTNFEIVDYVNNLKSSPFITDIALLESRQTAEGGLMIYSFKLNFKFHA
ncbi:MAG TPA: PilN domain-containing protein [Nitrospiria bacterium]|nr:PilN domain-containing protein [Nitrospiria bacterium]